MKFTKSLLLAACALSISSFSQAATAVPTVPVQQVTLAAATQGKINLNTADVKTLSKGIKGIGAKRAAAIVAYRDMYGAFKSLDDLAKVKGLSKKVVDRYRPTWEQILTLG